MYVNSETEMGYNWTTRAQFPQTCPWRKALLLETTGDAVIKREPYQCGRCRTTTQQHHQNTDFDERKNADLFYYYWQNHNFTPNWSSRRNEVFHSSIQAARRSFLWILPSPTWPSLIFLFCRRSRRLSFRGTSNKPPTGINLFGIVRQPYNFVLVLVHSDLTNSSASLEAFPNGTTISCKHSIAKVA